MNQTKSKIISVINQKGGCGKTSTCFHLAGYFAKTGKRVLLVDADPQGSLSQAFFGSTFIENLPKEKTTAAALDPEIFVAELTELTLPTDFENIEIIPANGELAKLNLPAELSGSLEQFELASLLGSENGFDIVLIDCPPNLYQCSWNALLASEFIAIPLNADDFGVQGLKVMLEAVELAAQIVPDVRLLGQFFTKFDRRVGLHREYETTLRRIYGKDVFQTVVQEAAAFKMAVSNRRPVTHYSSWSRANRQIKSLGNEMMERMQGHRNRQKAE